MVVNKEIPTSLHYFAVYVTKTMSVHIVHRIIYNAFNTEISVLLTKVNDQHFRLPQQQTVFEAVSRVQAF